MSRAQIKSAGSGVPSGGFSPPPLLTEEKRNEDTASPIGLNLPALEKNELAQITPLSQALLSRAFQRGMGNILPANFPSAEAILAQLTAINKAFPGSVDIAKLTADTATAEKRGRVLTLLEMNPNISADEINRGELSGAFSAEELTRLIARTQADPTVKLFLETAAKLSALELSGPGTDLAERKDLKAERTRLFDKLAEINKTSPGAIDIKDLLSQESATRRRQELHLFLEAHKDATWEDAAKAGFAVNLTQADFLSIRTFQEKRELRNFISTHDGVVTWEEAKKNGFGKLTSEEDFAVRKLSFAFSKAVEAKVQLTRSYDPDPAKDSPAPVDSAAQAAAISELKRRRHDVETLIKENPKYLGTEEIRYAVAKAFEDTTEDILDSKHRANHLGAKQFFQSIDSALNVPAILLENLDYLLTIFSRGGQATVGSIPSLWSPNGVQQFKDHASEPLRKAQLSYDGTSRPTIFENDAKMSQMSLAGMAWRLLPPVHVFDLAAPATSAFHVIASDLFDGLYLRSFAERITGERLTDRAFEKLKEDDPRLKHRLLAKNLAVCGLELLVLHKVNVVRGASTVASAADLSPLGFTARAGAVAAGWGVGSSVVSEIYNSADERRNFDFSRVGYNAAAGTAQSLGFMATLSVGGLAWARLRLGKPLPNSTEAFQTLSAADQLKLSTALVEAHYITDGSNILQGLSGFSDSLDHIGDAIHGKNTQKLLGSLGEFAFNLYDTFDTRFAKINAISNSLTKIEQHSDLSPRTPSPNGGNTVFVASAPPSTVDITSPEVSPLVEDSMRDLEKYFPDGVGTSVNLGIAALRLTDPNDPVNVVTFPNETVIFDSLQRINLLLAQHAIPHSESGNERFSIVASNRIDFESRTRALLDSLLEKLTDDERRGITTEDIDNWIMDKMHQFDSLAQIAKNAEISLNLALYPDYIRDVAFPPHFDQHAAVIVTINYEETNPLSLELYPRSAISWVNPDGSGEVILRNQTDLGYLREGFHVPFGWSSYQLGLNHRSLDGLAGSKKELVPHSGSHNSNGPRAVTTICIERINRN